jgi:hypothetical protein
MSCRVARRWHAFSVVAALFLVAITVLAVVASQAQQTDTGRSSAASSAASVPTQGRTPMPTQQRLQLPEVDNIDRAAVGRSQGKKAASTAADGTNPLFLPVVTYSTGGTNASAVAVADVNRDGTLDVIAANSGGSPSDAPASVAVLLGNGNGTFKPAVTYDTGGEYPSAIVVADVNADGKPDLVISTCCESNGDGEVSVLIGNGDGTFQAAVVYDSGNEGRFSTPIVVDDLRGDGKLDIVTVSYGSGTVNVLLSNGDGTFQPATIYDLGAVDTFSIAATDLNGDGIADLIVGNVCGTPGASTCEGSVSVLLGNGDGTFQAVVTYDAGVQWMSSVTVADLNGDGKPDIVTAGLVELPNGNHFSTYGMGAVLLNNGNGTFAAAQDLPDASGIILALAVADVAGGEPDLLILQSPSVAGGESVITLWLGQGNGSFGFGGYSLEGGGGESLAVADINGDGNPDVLSTNDSVCSTSVCPASTISTLLGHGDGIFQPAQIYTTDGWDSTAVVSDLNGDGKPDLLVLNGCSDANCDSTVGVLLNNTARPFNPTTTALVSNVNPAAVNQEVTYTATLTSQYGGTATGTMTFQDGSTTVARVALTGNQAVYTASYAKTGNHSITAAYSGDADNGFSTSGTLIEHIAVLPAKSTTVVTTSGSPSFVGQAVTFTATVTSGSGTIPNGEVVVFSDNGETIGTSTTTGQVATFTTSSLAARTHGIKATYSGDAAFKPSSGPVKQVVEKYATTTTLVPSVNPSSYGQAVTFTATVISSGPNASTGTVTFKDGSTGIGTATVSGGVATLTKSKLAVGSHSIIGTYEGDAASAKSSSAVLTQVVN